MGEKMKSRAEWADINKRRAWLGCQSICQSLQFATIACRPCFRQPPRRCLQPRLPPQTTWGPFRLRHVRMPILPATGRPLPEARSRIPSYWLRCPLCRGNCSHPDTQPTSHTIICKRRHHPMVQATYIGCHTCALGQRRVAHPLLNHRPTDGLQTTHHTTPHM